MLQKAIYASFSIAVVLLTSPSFARGPAPDVPELKVLDQFVGRWEAIDPDGQKMVSETEWTLNGRFVKQNYSDGDDTEGMIMRGYSPSLEKYTMTIFDSNATAVMLLGDWNAESKTLPCVGQLGNGVVMIATQSFPNPDTEAYSFTIKLDDQVLNEFQGENRRIKNE